MKKAILILVTFVFSTVQAQDQWTLYYSNDDFSQDALLDLSYLNEDEAGENGFIQQSPDGGGFVNGVGEEVRFWAVGGGGLASRNTFRPLNDAQLAYYAKFLAKKGVNMIRYHGAIHSVTNYLDSVNKEEVQDIWRLVGAMKKEGIYTTISPFWAGHVSNMPSAWGLGDYQGQDVKPWALMYFDQKFKNAYKHWVTYLFTEINPYTGVALKDDPSVGLIQIKNEDGVFFWTIQDVKPSLMSLMQSQFHDWLIVRYGTIEDAYAAWNNETLPEDDPAQGKMGLHIIWFATQEQTGGLHARITDQIRFYTETQRSFYQEIYEHLRSIGCKQLINAMNWKTADPIKLFDAERYTNEVCDVMAVNRYYSPQHIGNNSGWRIEPGHQYVGQSALYVPHKLPINVKQVEGKPFIVSESAWNLPHKYQAEGPFLIASYMSLTGFDAYYWFSPSSHKIDTLPYWDFANVQGQMPMFRWTVSIPGQMDLFPANALMFRKGYIQQGENLVHEERTLQSIMERETPLISEENSFDPNRDDWNNAGGSGETELAPITYLAGPVTVTYDGNPSNTFISSELGELIDYSGKKITSVTGELVWDYGKGICSLDAPSAKGICGFPGETEAFQLSDVTIKTKNEYLAVNVVAMDEQSINQSEKILIQVGTIYRPTLWREAESSFELGGETVDGFLIQNVGTMPWLADVSQLSVVINNPNIESAWVLNQNGYEAREIFVGKDENDPNYKEIFVPRNAMYVIADTRPASVTSLGRLQLEDIRIFPNPSEGRFRIESPGDKSYYDEVEILNLTGKVLKRYSDVSGQDEFDLHLRKGVYLIQLKSRDKIVRTEKLLFNGG